MPRPRDADESQILVWLRMSQFCQGVDDDVLNSVARCVAVRSFDAGDLLGSAGDTVTAAWILAEGQTEASYRDAHGRDHVLMQANPGDHAGDLALLQGEPWPATIKAMTSGTLLEIPAAAFQELISANPRLLRNLFSTLGMRFKKFIGILKRRIPAPILGMVGSTSNSLLLFERIVQRLEAAGERICVWSGRPERIPRGQARFTALESEAELTAAIRGMRDPSDASFDRLIIVSVADSGSVDPRGLAEADEVQWHVEAADWEPSYRRWNEAVNSIAGFRERTRLIWLLNPKCPVVPFPHRWKPAIRSIAIPLIGNSPGATIQERNGIERLFRSLRGYSIGLALAGGGARGMAHFGVLRALDRAGIGFDMVSGTSCGAMVGACYAAGFDPDWSVEQFRRDLTPPALFRRVPKGRLWYLLAKYRRGSWDAMLRKYLHDWRLEQLPLANCAVTVDLITARDVVRERGDAVHAILESINMPVISRPILRDGMALVDGGVLNNLPADVLANRGVDFVVGVDVSSHLRAEFARNRPGMAQSQMKRPNAIETILRVFEAQTFGMGNVRNRAVDFWIAPNTSMLDFTEFGRAPEFADAGEAAACEAIPRLKEQLADLERRLTSVASL